MEKLTRDGVALAYNEAGRGGPPIVLVHCWAGDQTFSAPQFDHFRRTHRVVTVDLRGHGASDTPHQDYTVGGFADDLAWLCGQLRVERPVVVGHSMGGNVALELAARHPGLPAAIVLLDACIVPPPALAEGLPAMAAGVRGPDYAATVRQIAGAIALPTDDPARTARIADVMAAVPQHVLASAFEQHLLRWDGAAAMAACAVPALYVGAAAPLSDVARLRELCPQLVVGQTVGAGHFHNQEVPEQVNAMIARFLALLAPHPAHAA